MLLLHNKTFLEIATRTWSFYLVDILSSIFLVFTPSVGVKHFRVDLDGKHIFAPTLNVGVVHMWVCVCDLDF